MRFVFAPMTSAILLIVPCLLVGQSAQNASGRPEPLDAYLSCRYGAGLNVVSALRMQGDGLRYRDITTAEGKKRVSVIDGYRLMLSQGEPSFFANLHIEKSDPRQYARDKDVVIKSLEYAMDARPGPKAFWDHMPYNGFDVYSLSDTTMGANGPNGIYVLFRDSTQTIVTIYFLGQKPEHRHFATIQEHDAIVDKMIEDLTTCANAPPAAVTAGNLPPLRTPEDLDRFMNKYYLQPRPDRIADAMVMLTTSGVLQIPEAVGTITGFFSEVFLTNPSRVGGWQTVIDKQPGFAKSVLDSAAAWSKAGGVLQLPGQLPQMNDFYWGAFFASGNPMYVKKLLELAAFATRRDDFNVWMIGATAKWSLARNSRQHALVRSLLEEEKRTSDKLKEDLVDDILKRDPERMRQEMVDFRNKQIMLGKWK
jgi:hypothetical protein